MTFKLNGTMWRIKYALQRVESLKNELVTEDMEDVAQYLETVSGIDKEKVKEIIRDADREFENGKRS